MTNGSSPGLAAPAIDFKAAFESIPANSVLVQANAPHFTILAATDYYARVSGKSKDELVGKAFFNVFPANPEDPGSSGEMNVRASFEQVILHKVPHQVPILRHDIANDKGTFTERYWSAFNKPVLSEEGALLYIIHTAEDVTAQVKAAQRAEKIKSMERAYDLFMQAPVAINILKGPELVIEWANTPSLDVWGKGPEVVGRSLLEVVPELQKQGFKELVQQVRESGKPHHAYEQHVCLIRNGRAQDVYFNWVLQPYYEEDQTGAVGILTFALEVTEQVWERQKAAASEARYQDLIAQATVATGVYTGREMTIAYANDAMIRLWGKDPSVIGKTIGEALPELKGQPFHQQLDDVFTTGVTYWGKEDKGELIVNGTLQTFYFNFSYKALRNADGTIYGILNMATDVTDQVLAKKKLEESEQELAQFKYMADNAQDPFILMRQDGSFAYLNPKALEAWGYTAEEAKRLRVPDVDPIYNDEVFSAAFASAQTESIPQFETLHKRKDGHIYPVEVNMGGLVLGGKPHMFAIARNITERKKAEEALVEKDRNFRSIIHRAPVAMAIFRGAQMVIETVNQNMLELIGKTNEITGKPLLEILPELKGQPVFEALNQVFHSGKPYNGNEWLVPLLRNGVLEERYFNFAFTPVVENEKVVGVMDVATEVTEQVIDRNKIEESHTELQFVMDVMPVMVWHSLPDGTADYFNQVYLDYTGLSVRQLKGHQWTTILHPDDVQITGDVWQRALASGDWYVVEHRLRGKDGLYRWFLTRGVPLKDERGHILKWYGTTTDIQAQKTAAEILEQRVEERTKDLQEANADLMEANRDLEQFTHVSHHDLQEPLRKIIMFSDMVRSDSYDRLSEASQKRFDKITEAARRMSTALKDVLNYASLNKEELFACIDLDEILAAVQSDLEMLVAEKAARISSDALPTIRAIPQQMHQLFYNLLNNALKFSRQDGPPVITVTCRPLGETAVMEHPELDAGKHYFEIVVQDNGIGFTPDAADKIFVMFQRLHSKEAYAGTGIGLALCKKVVLNHGGKIWAESNIGEGATFRVILPAG